MYKKLEIPGLKQLQDDADGEMDSHALENYERKTGAPRKVKLPLQTQGDGLTLSAISKGYWERAWIVRYDGYMYEIDPGEYEYLRDDIPESLYYLFRTTWFIADRPGFSDPQEVNETQVRDQLTMIPGELQSTVKQYFMHNYNFFSNSNSTAKSAFNPNTYRPFTNEDGKNNKLKKVSSTQKNATSVRSSYRAG